MNDKNERKKKEQDKNGAEKPISLWAASFIDVLGALLKTKPMPKESKKKGLYSDKPESEPSWNQLSGIWEEIAEFDSRLSGKICFNA